MYTVDATYKNTCIYHSSGLYLTFAIPIVVIYVVYIILGSRKKIAYKSCIPYMVN
jgi:hypothetical protein